MYERRFLVFEFFSVFAALAKVWVLVDSARNQAGDGGAFFGIWSEDLRKAGRKGSGRLGGTEVEFAYIVAREWSV